MKATSIPTPDSLSNDDLLVTTHDLARRSCVVEADLLAHLGEIDDRLLYAAHAYESMFAFCVGELGFSEGAAFNRIAVARAARRFPAIIDAVRSRSVHLAGLRVLLPHLTEENHARLLALAGGKTKREVELMMARLAPRAPVPTVIRKLPRSGTFPAGDAATGAADQAGGAASGMPGIGAADGTAAGAPLQSNVDEIAMAPSMAAGSLSATGPRAVVEPLAEDSFKIQFTASQAFYDKLREAQDLLRHRIPDGDVARVLGAALDTLVEQVKKERFAVGRKPRATKNSPTAKQTRAAKRARGRRMTRHVPAAVARALHERDEGRCTFVDARGRRCGATSGLQIDHVDGFARTHSHDLDGLRLACLAHNKWWAEQLYGREFMKRARSRRPGKRRPGRVEPHPRRNAPDQATPRDPTVGPRRGG